MSDLGVLGVWITRGILAAAALLGAATVAGLAVRLFLAIANV